jgi:coproporphyrinogen III oxidase-like Fe-S oxidoreductase
MTIYHALQILGMTDAPMTVQQIDAKAIDQVDAEALAAELEAARGEGLVTLTGNRWALTEKGRDLYS